MSTRFVNEGNIGSPPEHREIPTDNDEPRQLLRLNVYFDHPVPTNGGQFEDRGGFWAPVEWWHDDAEHFAALFQKGMRVVVDGHFLREEWEDREENPRVTFKIRARRISLLPYRISGVTMSAKATAATDADHDG
jgi:single-strand DNA-binding protein